MTVRQPEPEEILRMSIPASMQAVRIAAPGGPEVLDLATLPVPQPGPGELLVRVAAAGVNRPDVLQRLGHYPPPPGAPDTPGLEIAGTVVAAGAGTNRFRPGDEVCALVAGGGYAEYCLAPEPQALPVPDGLDAVQAAAIPETFVTVWTNVFERGGLGGDDILLVHGGSSGIGTTAIQLARAFGYRVFVTAGGAEKCRACTDLGAEAAIDYREEDFVEAVKRLTGGRGVDVILDMVGGDYVQRNLDCLAPDGRLVSIAFLRGPKVQVNLMPMMMKRLTVTGSTLRARPIEEKGRTARALEQQVWPHLAAGRIRPVIDSTFPLAQAAEAHRRIDSGAHVGKIVLTP
jgi:putative PIG3 family NAD(P)H quinone oxidoreductase